MELCLSLASWLHCRCQQQVARDNCGCAPLEYLIKNFNAEHLFSVKYYSLFLPEAKQTGISSHKLYTTPSIFRAMIQLKHNDSPFKLKIWTKLMFIYLYSHCTYADPLKDTCIWVYIMRCTYQIFSYLQNLKDCL